MKLLGRSAAEGLADSPMPNGGSSSRGVVAVEADEDASRGSLDGSFWLLEDGAEGIPQLGRYLWGFGRGAAAISAYVAVWAFVLIL